jgi:DNA polymerase-3 subunit alpha
LKSSYDDFEATENTNKLADRVEDYDLAKPARIPDFKCPKKYTTESYFKELCTQGFNKKITGKIEDYENKKEIYFERVKMEIAVLKEANLFNYFLILRDIIDYAKSQGYLVGPGRGSVAGCLVAYLLDIHQIDSIKYDLIFERFFNKGRVGSLPDIDTDFPKRSRADIIKYITKKYGKDNVMQIATYSTLMGRAALKAVFRASKSVSFSEQNEITKNVVDKAKISDELQEMEEPSVIRWCLINKKDELSPWCSINEDGRLDGPLAKEFEQAIKLEGVICNLSKHAAGVVIGPESLRNLVPVVYDSKDKQQIIGCQMNELEYVGLVKLDCLSLSTLDRLEDINEI